MTETAVATTQMQTPAQLIEQAVATGTSPEALEKLMDLQDRWMAKQAEQSFHGAVTEFQMHCPPIVKQKSASFKGQKAYDYAGYEDIMHIIQKPLAQCGLSLSFDSEVIEGNMLKTTCIVSGHGHRQTSSVTLPVPAEMRVNATQKAGAGLSYGKRYSLVNALNLVVVGEDSDAALLYQSAQLIDDKQVDTINDMLDTLDAQESGTRDKFMNWINQLCGAVEVAAIPQNQYNSVHNALRNAMARGAK